MSQLPKYPVWKKARSWLGRIRRQWRARARRTLQQKERLLRDPSLTAPERTLLAQVDARISPHDGMYVGDGNHYYRVGLSAIQCIERVVKAANIHKIAEGLDLPCGHGRVLRFLVKRFPETRFTACDLDHDAVDFCAEIWDVDRAYSRVDLNEFSLGQQFDFIWSGSLITHLDESKIVSLLEFFIRHLSLSGLVIFTTAGERVQEWMVNGQFDYGISRNKIPVIVKDYKATGYGYTDYPYRSDYGISLTSPEWIDKQIKTLSIALKRVYFEPHAWDNHQDVYGYVKS